LLTGFVATAEQNNNICAMTNKIAMRKRGRYPFSWEFDDFPLVSAASQSGEVRIKGFLMVRVLLFL